MVKRLSVKTLDPIRKHRFILQKLSTANAANRKKMLMNAPGRLFGVFKALCKLVTDGYLSLGKAKRHKKLASEIGTSKISTIKGMVQQHGGAIASIIAGVLPFLAPLISKLFKL